MEMRTHKKLSRKAKLSFAGVSGAAQIIDYAFLYFIMIFYTDVFGISPAVAGTLLLVARLWDSVNDVLVGVIIDKTKSKKGKARPYIFYLAIPTAIFFVLTFTTPNLSYTGKVIWAYITYIGLGMCLTFTMIATLTLLPRMSKDSIERTSLSSYYSIGSTIFMLLVSALWFPMVSALGKGNDAKGYIFTAIIFGIVVIALFFVGYANCEEICDEEKEKSKNHKASEIFRAAISNSQLLLMALMGLVSGIGSGFFSGSLIYYLKYNLQRPDLAAIFMPVIVLMMVISSFTTTKLVKWIGKFKAMVWMNVLFVIFLGIRYITMDQSTIVLFFLLVCAGFCAGTLNILFMAMLTDTMIYGEVKTGIKVEGLGMAAFTFQIKMGGGISGALLGFMLESGHYVPNAISQSQEALATLFNANITFYLVSRIICLFLLYFYKLTDEKVLDLQRTLETRSSDHDEAGQREAYDCAL